MLIYAIISISLALVLYTVGVWSEKIQGVLTQKHLVLFWGGLLFDTLGTTMMSIISDGGFKLNFHGITGLLAILLMLFHVTWATLVLRKKDEKAKQKFHKLSFVVWLIWLVPYLSGAIFGMGFGN